MKTPKHENALDHVVVIMFENRSFDNLLGQLYEPGEVASFEGVIGKNPSNPILEWAGGGPAASKTASARMTKTASRDISVFILFLFS
jgi:phospholipase C